MKVMDKVYDVVSTLEGESVEMAVDPGAMAHIMDIMTNLYSDAVLACVREYSTNALDAHKVAGQTRPIEVTLPSPLAPFFSVRDFGDGLNRDDINDIYRMYGASTKRDSNEVVGMLGLGCKSALAYTNGFTLIGIKNGMLTTASIGKDEEGRGVITIMDAVPTNDPSGVEIIIPVLRQNDFDETAKNFFRFWEAGTVLVNGQEPKRIDGIWIADDLLLSHDVTDDTVVMGGVPYPMSEDANNDYYYRNRPHVVAFVAIGSVSFTPSRESLMFNTRTKEAVKVIKERVKSESQTAFAKMIDDAPTKEDALKVYHEVVKVGYTENHPRWNGKTIPLSWKASTGTFFLTATAVKQRGRSGRGNKDFSIANDSTEWTWIKNFDGAELTSYKREKLEQHMNRLELPKPKYFALVDQLPVIIDDASGQVTDRVSDWFDKDHILDWNVVNREKIIREKVQRADGRPSGSYHGMIGGNRERVIKAEDIDTSKPLFYERGQTGYYTYYDSPGMKLARDLFPDATLIILGQNRIAKFKRDFPMAKEINTYMHQAATDWSNALTDSDKMFLSLYDDRNRVALLKKVAPIKDKLDDPELVNEIVTATQKIPSKLVADWSTWKQWGATRVAGTIDAPSEKYPLLTFIDTYGTLGADTLLHLELYLNAAFAADTEV